MSKTYPSVIFSGVEHLLGDCKLEIVIHFSDSMNVQTALDEISMAFASAGSLGAFANASSYKVDSIVVYKGQALAQKNAILVEFFTTNIDFKAFQFFRNMNSYLQVKDVVVSRIDVRVENSTGNKMLELPGLTDINESDAYPRKVIAPDSPELIWGDSEFSKTRRVLVEFGALLSREQFEDLSFYANAWYQLLEMGAFAMPVGLPYETDSIRGRVSLLDEITYEISIDRYIASEVGFGVLANMLFHFSKNVIQIIKVEID